MFSFPQTRYHGFGGFLPSPNRSNPHHFFNPSLALRHRLLLYLTSGHLSRYSSVRERPLHRLQLRISPLKSSGRVQPPGKPTSPSPRDQSYVVDRSRTANKCAASPAPHAIASHGRSLHTSNGPAPEQLHCVLCAAQTDDLLPIESLNQFVQLFSYFYLLCLPAMRKFRPYPRIATDQTTTPHRGNGLHSAAGKASGTAASIACTLDSIAGTSTG